MKTYIMSNLSKLIAMKTLILTFFLIVILCSGCEPLDDRFTIINHTERPIFYNYSPIDSIVGKSPFQDFIKISESQKDTIWLQIPYFIKPKGEIKKSIVGD